MHISTQNCRVQLMIKAVFVSALIIETLLNPIALGQTSFRSAMGAGVLEIALEEDERNAVLLDSEDYNNDGLKDLLFGFSSDDEKFFAAINQGDAQFDIVGPFTVNTDYIALNAGDIDGDNSIEFVLRPYFTNNINIMVFTSIDGATAFEGVPNIQYTNYDFFDEFQPVIVAGDIDGDGGSDFVFNTTNQRVVVRWSSRDQSNPYEHILIPEIVDKNMIYAINDYDADGHNDILVFDDDSAQFILIQGTGTNTMGAVRVIDSVHPRINEGDRPLFGQFDSDPMIDLVVHDSLLGSASIVLNFAGDVPTSVDITTHEAIIPIGVEGDLDGSGHTDIIALRTLDLPPTVAENRQGVLLVDPLQTNIMLMPMAFGIPTGDVYATSNFHHIRVPYVKSLDINTDGDLDLIWPGYLPKGKIVRATLSRTEIDMAPRFGATYFQGRNGPLHVLAADIKGDSTPEAIVTGVALAGVYDLSDGTSVPLLNSLGAFMSASADIDGDGQQEIVLVGNSENIKVYSVAPDGTTGAPYIYSHPDLDTFQAMASADFDQDGHDDLAVSNWTTGSVHILRGIDGPSLEPWGLIDGFTASDVLKPAVIDFNTDGFPDLAIGDRANDQILIYQNHGDGTFTLSNTIPSSSPYWLIAKDIDLDGNVDFASVDNGTGLTIHFFNGSGQVEQTTVLVGSGSMVEVIAEDFSGSSLLDLAVATSSIGGFNKSTPMVWEQTSPREFSVAAILPTINAPGISATDINADGAVDIITVSNEDRSVMIHWGTPEGCLADFTGEGILDFFDISAFIQAFGANEQVADLTNDGILDFFDISAFIQAFAAGCP